MGAAENETNSRVSVRPVRPDEDAAVWELASTLSVLERYYFYCLIYRPRRSQALVAVADERIVGCVIPVVTTIAGEKAGVVGGIFVDRRVQGRGVGKALADAALLHFQAEGCQTCYVLVNRFNSPSWNMFLHKRFQPFDVNMQLQALGPKIGSLWWQTGYLLEPGTSILRKGRDHGVAEWPERYHVALACLGTYLAWVFLLGVNQQRWASVSPWSAWGLATLGVISLSLVTHELSHKLVARLLGVKTGYRVWESGLAFSAMMALLGIFYPSHGSTFVHQKDWPYHQDRRKMGLIYMVGPLVSLVLSQGLASMPPWGDRMAPHLVEVGFSFNFGVALFNLIPIFPFDMFDGSKVFRWNTWVWALLVTGLALTALRALA